MRGLKLILVVVAIVAASVHHRPVRADQGCGQSGLFTIDNRPPPPADFDRDGDVDADDFAVFAACAAGPAVAHETGEACTDADFDGDGDVDSSDFAVFQRCYSGEGNPADPECTE